MKNINELVTSLEQKGILKTPSLKQAFLIVDRTHFVLPEYKNKAYEDHALLLKEKQTISQPLTVAFMLEKLKPLEGQKILDIGSGSGWTTALLAEIVGSKGKVYAIERIKSLKKFGEKNVNRLGYQNVNFKEANGAKGWPEYAPFDRILVNAAATAIPIPLKEQLKSGGKLVIPLADVYGHISLIEKISDKEFTEQLFPGFSFVPLIESED